MITLITMLFSIGCIILLYLVGLNQLQTWQIHLIRKGNHYSSRIWPHLFLTRSGFFSFNTYLTRGYSYSLPKEDQKDINKLYGLGWGWRGPNWNSVRIGWRWSNYEQKIEILTYIQDSSRDFLYETLTFVSPGDLLKFTFLLENKGVSIYLYRDNKPTIFKHYQLKQSLDGVIKYRCLPYFGGNQTSPSDVKILIKEGK